jgi:hypothetical protein
MAFVPMRSNRVKERAASSIISMFFTQSDFSPQPTNKKVSKKMLRTGRETFMSLQCRGRSEIPIMTAHQLARFWFKQRNRMGRTIRLHLRASWMKAAAAGKISGTRNVAGNGLETVRMAAERWDRSNQSACVGMFGTLQNFVGGSEFDDLARIHDCDLIGDFCDEAQVVRDQEDRHAQAIFQIAQEVEDLRLDRDVERGGGFVGHEKFGFRGEGHRDHDALLHAAGKLVRIIVEASFGGGNADEFEKSNHFVVRGGVWAMQAQTFHDLIANAKNWVQRGRGILENVTDDAPANGAQFIFCHAQNVTAFHKNLTARITRRRARQQSRQRKRSHAFSRTAFANESQRLSRFNRKRNIIHDEQQTRLGGKFNAQIANID